MILKLIVTRPIGDILHFQTGLLYFTKWSWYKIIKYCIWNKILAHPIPKVGLKSVVCKMLNASYLYPVVPECHPIHSQSLIYPVNNKESLDKVEHNDLIFQMLSVVQVLVSNDESNDIQ